MAFLPLSALAGMFGGAPAAAGGAMGGWGPPGGMGGSAMKPDPWGRAPGQPNYGQPPAPDETVPIPDGNAGGYGAPIPGGYDPTAPGMIQGAPLPGKQLPGNPWWQTNQAMNPFGMVPGGFTPLGQFGRGQSPWGGMIGGFGAFGRPR